MFYIMDTATSAFGSLFRPFFFELNQTLYSFIADLYSFLIKLAEQTRILVTESEITTYTEKIYVLIGIIMLFRAAIVLLKYIADPDASSKSGEGGKMVSHVMVVLVLIVLVPTAFEWMYDLQSAIFNSKFFTNFFVSIQKEELTGTTESKSIIYEDGVNNFSCEYVSDASTNQLCFNYPFSDNDKIYKDGGMPVYANVSGAFCPKTITVSGNLATGASSIKVEMEKADGTTYILPHALYDYTTLFNMYETKGSDSDTCYVNYETTVLKGGKGGEITPITSISSRYYGLQFLVPASISDIAYTSESAWGNYMTAHPSTTYDTYPSYLTCASSNCVVDNYTVALVQTDVSGNTANFRYIHTVPGGSGATYRTDNHPFGMTFSADEYTSLSEDAAEKANSAKTGSKFADIIMMSFITPNIDSTSSGDLFTQYQTEAVKLDLSVDEYDAANAVDYAVIGDLITKKNPDKADYYAFEYNYFLSLIAAIVVIIMLVATLFKAALRIFKLMTLQIIAPIPIILYLDPKAKNGGSLEKWFQAVIQTYADLFIRILVIAFVGVMIAKVGSTINSDSYLLNLFIIFGALMFMNIAPEFILGLFGIKAEKGSFNPLAQIGAVPGLQKGLSAGFGAAGGAFKGATQGGIAGAGVGLLLGAKGGMNSKTLLGAGGAGRDFMGKSLANGSDETGGIAQRFLQDKAAGALRADANAKFNTAKEFKDGTLKTSKDAFKAADTRYNAASASVNENRAKLSSVASMAQVYRDRAKQFADAGDTVNATSWTAKADKYMVDAKDIQIDLSRSESDLSAATIARDDAVRDYNRDIDTFNKMHEDYTREVSEVNRRTGKASNQYEQEKVAPDFKRVDKVE